MRTLKDKPVRQASIHSVLLPTDVSTALPRPNSLLTSELAMYPVFQSV